jgi:hypothetical protein
MAVTACRKSSSLQRSELGKRSRRRRYPCRREEWDDRGRRELGQVIS